MLFRLQFNELSTARVSVEDKHTVTHLNSTENDGNLLATTYGKRKCGLTPGHTNPPSADAKVIEEIMHKEQFVKCVMNRYNK